MSSLSAWATGAMIASYKPTGVVIVCVRSSALAGRRHWVHEVCFLFGGTSLDISRAAIVAGFALQSFDTFFRDDGNHDEARHGIGPPKADGRVQKKTRKEYGRKISTDLGLLRVRVHCCTAKGASHSSFRTRKERHHDKRNAGK